MGSSHLGESLQQPFTVVHVFDGPLRGGAAKGAYGLHEGLLHLGVDSRVVSSSKVRGQRESIDSSSWTGIEQLEWRLRRRLEQRWIDLQYPNRLNTTFSLSVVGAPVARHPWIKDADIVHLHWINGGFLRLEEIARIDKPIVWTLRDLWPATGGCHYPMGCERYHDSCGRCPQLGSSSTRDATDRLMSRKRVIYGKKNITFVGISDWVSEMARLSAAIPETSRVLTIPNSIRTASFSPHDSPAVRRRYGFPEDLPIVLLGAGSVRSPYKGFDSAVSAVKSFGRDMFVVLFGADSEEAAREFPYARGVGTVSTTEALSELYSAADVFLAPSIAEAFGKTVVESMACATPVVAFAETGPGTIIEHKVDGYLARPFEPNDLARGIRWMLEDDHRRRDLGRRARRKALREFDSHVAAGRYVDLYRQLIRERSP